MNILVIDLADIGITTSQPREHLEMTARKISRETGIAYYPRNNLSATKLKEAFNLQHLIVVREDKIVADNVFFFHPGMAVARIKMLKAGQPDPMIEGMAIEKGSKVLDCTLGLANDALVASFQVGETGKVVGLESSPIIYIITKWGLAGYTQGSKDCRKAMKNIQVHLTDYQNYFKDHAEDSFDVVYFDPMFTNPYHKSSGIEGLRSYANYYQPQGEIIQQALQIAKDRVVIKDRKDSDYLEKINVDKIVGGKYSSVKYGIIYK